MFRVRLTSREECNYRVFDSIIEDLIPPSISIFESLLKTTKIIIFAGDRDIICNYIGLENSLARFGNPTELPWKYGSVKEWGNLSLFVVTNASHMVSYDHPIAAKEVSRSLLGIRIDPGDSAKVSKDTTNDGVVNIQAPSHFIAGLFLLGFFVLAVFGGLYLRKKIVKTSSPPKW